MGTGWGADHRREFHALPVEERGTPHTVFAGCGVDDFNYGIHAYSLLSGLMGPGALSVRHIGQHVQRRVQVNWSDGRVGFVIVGSTDKWIPFYATVVTEKGCRYIQADNSRLYRALLEKTLPYLAGEAGAAPVSLPELLEPELCAIAALVSWSEGDREVYLSELSDSSPAYDGERFAQQYRAQRYPAK